MNQDNKSLLVNKAALTRFIEKTFPPVELSFAYGSGVFAQAGKAPASANAIDLIFVVEDVAEFHAQNIRANASHYSGLSRLFGAHYVRALQRHVAPVHFNPDIRVQGVSLTAGAGEIEGGTKIKYGVVSRKAFTRDLLMWDSMIMAGRLHKPVLFLTRSDPEQGKIDLALNANIVSAATMGLVFCMGQTEIEESEFLDTICSLSYIGDVRFSLGAEAPDKIQSIVQGSLARFRDLYAQRAWGAAESPLRDISQYDVRTRKIYLDQSDAAQQRLIEYVPEYLAAEYTGRDKDVQLSFKQIEFKNVQKILRECLIKKNKFWSRQMILYNVLATSPLKNAVYALRKLKKGVLKR